MKLQFGHSPAITALFQRAASGSPTLTCAQPFGRGAASNPLPRNVVNAKTNTFRFAPLVFAVVLLMLPLPAFADWQAWLENNDCTQGLPGIISEVADTTGIDPVDLAALSMQESNCKHYDSKGNVKAGDSGLSVGTMQIQQSPWVKHWRKELDDDTLTRYDMADNVLMAAHILLYSGYETDRIRSFARYNGSSKHPNYRYARSVDKFAKQARDYEEEK